MSENPNSDHPVSEVHNLATGETYVFTLPPDEALISAYLMESKQAGMVSDPATREKVRAMIQEGKQSLAIGDLAVRSGPIVLLRPAANDEVFEDDEHVPTGRERPRP